MAFDLSRSGSRSQRAAPEMNVTPLVDVVLVLLIIFMVVTPLMAKQFWVHVPPAAPAAASAPDRPSIVVTVDASGAVEINRQAVSRDALRDRLRSILARTGDRTVVFDAHADAPYALAVEALDECRESGAATLAVAAEPILP